MHETRLDEVHTRYRYRCGNSKGLLLRAKHCKRSVAAIHPWDMTMSWKVSSLDIFRIGLSNENLRNLLKRSESQQNIDALYEYSVRAEWGNLDEFGNELKPRFPQISQLSPSSGGNGSNICLTSFSPERSTQRERKKADGERNRALASSTRF